VVALGQRVFVVSGGGLYVVQEYFVNNDTFRTLPQTLQYVRD
jgi:hypothetical protein